MDLHVLLWAGVEGRADSQQLLLELKARGSWRGQRAASAFRELLPVRPFPGSSSRDTLAALFAAAPIWLSCSDIPVAGLRCFQCSQPRMDIPPKIQTQTLGRISVCHDTKRTRTSQDHGRQSRKWDLPPFPHSSPLPSSSHDIRYQGLLDMNTLRSVEQKLQGLPTLEIKESRWGTLRKTTGLSVPLKVHA